MSLLNEMLQVRLLYYYNKLYISMYFNHDLIGIKFTLNLCYGRTIALCKIQWIAFIVLIRIHIHSIKKKNLNPTLLNRYKCVYMKYILK